MSGRSWYLYFRVVRYRLPSRWVGSGFEPFFLKWVNRLLPCPEGSLLVAGEGGRFWECFRFSPVTAAGGRTVLAVLSFLVARRNCSISGCSGTRSLSPFVELRVDRGVRRALSDFKFLAGRVDGTGLVTASL